MADFAEVDLNQYPTPDPNFKPAPNSIITIGDLHANPMKLLTFLIHYGVLEITPDDYAKLVEIDTAAWNHTLTKEQAQTFKDIIEKAKINPIANVLYIGDTKSDRGSFDFFD